MKLNNLTNRIDNLNSYVFKNINLDISPPSIDINSIEIEYTDDGNYFVISGAVSDASTIIQLLVEINMGEITLSSRAGEYES